MDETKLKLHGREVFVWVAIDIDTKELFSLCASYQRSSINQHNDVCQEGLVGMHQQALDPCGRVSMISVGDWKIWIEVASCNIRREEFDREILQDVQG